MLQHRRELRDIRKQAVVDLSTVARAQWTVEYRNVRTDRKADITPHTAASPELYLLERSKLDQV